jgi:DNA polymerase I-like protein with 3'-5' exonuclease and polymerase domains
MASMINENLSSFSLDNLCHWLGIPGKNEELLRDTMASFGIDKQKDIKSNLWQLDGKYVGPYAEQDAASTLHLAQIMRPLLIAENLEDAYQLECDLMPVTLRMKQRGIRIDKQRTETLANRVIEETDAALKKLGEDIGQKVGIDTIRSSRWLKQQFQERNINFPETDLGNPNFDKEFMADHPHWFPRTVHQIKHKRDLAERFLHKFILKYEYKGRVYPSVNQFRSEWGGARSHRFSYSDPPLQQMPSRDDELAPLVRSCFIPEEGETWYSIDYQQQEYRLIVFVAELIKKTGAKRAADMYRNDPTTDFHNYVAEITRLPRRRAKDVNFAKSYGAGVAKFALMTGMSREEAERTMKQYDETLPFVREAAEHYARFAHNNGYIKLIDGARNHFNQWEPSLRNFAMEYEYKKKNDKINTLPCDEEEAKRRKEDPKHPWYGERMKRSYTHKAFNRMIQGSAARQTKRAMRDIYRAGHHMLLQLHDELAFSFDSPDKAHECAKLMEEAVQAITIPMLTDIKSGPSWGELKKQK